MYLWGGLFRAAGIVLYVVQWTDLMGRGRASLLAMENEMHEIYSVVVHSINHNSRTRTESNRLLDSDYWLRNDMY